MSFLRARGLTRWLATPVDRPVGIQVTHTVAPPELSAAERERDEANELTDKIAAEMRLVTRERDSLARRLAVRFEALQKLTHQRSLAEAELASARQELEHLRARLGETTTHPTEGEQP